MVVWVIVQVSKELSDAEVEKLLEKAPNIRIVRVDTTFEKINGELTDDERRDYRFDLYAYLLEARKLEEEDIQNETKTYKIVQFFIKTHLPEDKEFRGAEATAVVTEYISALARDDIAYLTKRNLSYRPTGRWDVPDYHTIAVVLISA